MLNDLILVVVLVAILSTTFMWINPVTLISIILALFIIGLVIKFCIEKDE